MRSGTSCPMAVSSLRYPSVCLPEEREVCGGVVYLCVCEGEVWDRVPVCLLYVFVFSHVKKGQSMEISYGSS